MLGVQMNRKNIRVRKGQAPGKLSRDDFRARFFDEFTDPAFRAEATGSSCAYAKRRGISGHFKRSTTRSATNGAQSCHPRGPLNRNFNEA